MKVFFDQGTPVPLRKFLPEHQVATAYECGWSMLQNGELLDKVEKSGYEVFITTDTNLQYQQNLASRKIAIVVLLSTSWPKIKERVTEIITTVSQSQHNDYQEIKIT